MPGGIWQFTVRVPVWTEVIGLNKIRQWIGHPNLSLLPTSLFFLPVRLCQQDVTVWTLYAFTAVTLSTWPYDGNTCQEIIPDIDYENTKLTFPGWNIVSISKSIKTQQFQIPSKTTPFIGILIIHFLGSLFWICFFFNFYWIKSTLSPELSSPFYSPIS